MVRVRPSDQSDRLYPSPNEFEQIIKSMPSQRARLAARIMARSSPRAGFVVTLKRKHFFIPESADVKIGFVKIRGAKDTTDSDHDGKARISWVPARLFERVQDYCDHHSIGPDDELFDISYKTLNNDFKKAGENMMVRTGDEIWEDFRGHDCRRFYANHMIRRLNIDKDLVMEMGGWDSEAALKPYLLHSQPRSIQDRLERQGVLDKDVPEPRLVPEKERLHKRIELLQQQISDLTAKMQGKDVDLSRTGARTIDDITLDQLNEIQEDHFVDIDDSAETENNTESPDSVSSSKTDTTATSLLRFNDDVNAYDPLSAVAIAYCRTIDSAVDWAVPKTKSAWDEYLGFNFQAWLQEGTARRIFAFSFFIAMAIGTLSISMIRIGVYIDPTTWTITASRGGLLGLIVSAAVYAGTSENMWEETLADLTGQERIAELLTLRIGDSA